MSAILVIPDLHCPYHHPDAFDFLDKVATKYKTKKVICLGDEIDNHAISFHDSDPDLPFTASSELEKAIWHLKDLYHLFPKVKVMESNHSSLIYRRQKHHGLPRRLFRDYRDILEAPKGWEWVYDYTFKSGGKNIYFHHSEGKNVLKNSQLKSMCYVMGHHHSQFDIQYWANSLDLFWGMTAGCLIDKDSLAFAYGKNNIKKPIIGCGVILDGEPILIPMRMNKNGRWTKKLL